MVTGKSLRALRARRGLTLKELGRLCGIYSDDLARYERGEVQPRRENTAKIAEALGEPIAVIKDGLAWTCGEPPEDWEARDGETLLYQGILQMLEDAYGAVSAGTYKDHQGVLRSWFTIGTPPDDFILDEEDLAALAEALTASIAPLAERMRDLRPESEAAWELLRRMGDEPPEAREAQYELTDEQWEAVRDLLPSERTGRGRAFKDNRLVLNGILYWLHTGVPWRGLPKRYGRYRCVYDRLRLWNDTGVWPKVLARMLELKIIDEASTVVDSTRFKDTK